MPECVANKYHPELLLYNITIICCGIWDWYFKQPSVNAEILNLKSKENLPESFRWKQNHILKHSIVNLAYVWFIPVSDLFTLHWINM